LTQSQAGFWKAFRSSEHRTLDALKKVALEATDLHPGDSIDQGIIKECHEAEVCLLWGEKDLWVDTQGSKKEVRGIIDGGSLSALSTGKER